MFIIFGTGHLSSIGAKSDAGGKLLLILLLFEIVTALLEYLHPCTSLNIGGSLILTDLNGVAQNTVCEDKTKLVESFHFN